METIVRMGSLYGGVGISTALEGNMSFQQRACKETYNLLSERNLFVRV